MPGSLVHPRVGCADAHPRRRGLVLAGAHRSPAARPRFRLVHRGLRLAGLRPRSPARLPQRKRTRLAVSVVALAFPAAVLGLKRTALAGWLLVALGVLPLLITVIGRSGPVASLAAASVVPLIAGISYLVSARMASGSTSPGSQRAAAA